MQKAGIAGRNNNWRAVVFGSISMLKLFDD
jgi:hypothetical protein